MYGGNFYRLLIEHNRYPNLCPDQKGMGKIGGEVEKY